MAPSYQSDIESEPKVGGIKELIQLWSGLEAIETPISSNRHRRKSAVTDWGDVIRDLQKVVQRLLAERSNEVQVLKNKQLVSMFLHRKKIESCLLYKSAKIKVDDPLPQSAPSELDQIQRSISFWSLREIFCNPQRQTRSDQREQERQKLLGEFWSSSGTGRSSEGLQETSSQQSDFSWEEQAERLEMTKVDQYSDNGVDVFSTDNSEIVELLHRRTVSTSLASGFQEKLSKAVLSSLKRHQQRTTTTTTITMTEEDEAYHDGRRLRSDPGFSEMDVVLDMRSDIANLHNELSELRKLFVGFMEKYACSRDMEAAKMIGFCCVCNHKQIDSLIYRCGHMCTCFKCADDLKTNSGKCPICETPIVDVVRAHTYSDHH